MRTGWATLAPLCRSKQQGKGNHRDHDDGVGLPAVKISRMLLFTLSNIMGICIRVSLRHTKETVRCWSSTLYPLPPQEI
jgi:hypothetical protein